MNLDESLREIIINLADQSSPVATLRGVPNPMVKPQNVDEAIAKIKALVVESLPKEIKYIAEINGIRIAVNEAMRGTEWQLKSKEEIESYNQCLGEIRSIFE